MSSQYQTSSDDGQTTIGLSESAHEKLKELQDEGVFARLMDGYRFCMAFAIAQGQKKEVVKRNTIFNVGTFDPKQEIRNVVEVVTGESPDEVYRSVEKYAEWGVGEIYRLHESGSLDFAVLMEAPTGDNTE